MAEKLAQLGYDRDDLHLALQQSTEEEGDNVRSMTEEYHRYKREYVKHLNFNPDAENLSKCFLDLPT